MNEGDEELTIVLLAILHHEATIQTIVNLAAQAAVLQGSESTSLNAVTILCGQQILMLVVWMS
jgi:hypothetical protein